MRQLIWLLMTLIMAGLAALMFWRRTPAKPQQPSSPLEKRDEYPRKRDVRDIPPRRFSRGRRYWLAALLLGLPLSFALLDYLPEEHQEPVGWLLLAIVAVAFLTRSRWVPALQSSWADWRLSRQLSAENVGRSFDVLFRQWHPRLDDALRMALWQLRGALVDAAAGISGDDLSQARTRVTLRRTLTHYLPALLQGYLRLPRGLEHQRENGEASYRDLVIQSISLLDQQVRAIHRAQVAKDREALEAELSFLQQRVEAPPLR